MMSRNIAGVAIGGLLFVAVAWSAPSAAQPWRGHDHVLVDQHHIAIDFRPEDEVIHVPCCRCIDGSRNVLSVNTGTAPWTVTPPGSASFSLADSTTHAAWASLPPATWVGQPLGAEGTHVYTLRIHVPNCVIPSLVTVGGRFAADNQGRLYVGPYPAAIAATPLLTGFWQSSVTLFQRDITSPGLHILKVEVQNNDGPVGLLVRGEIVIVCPDDPVAHPDPPTRVTVPSRR